MMDAEGLDRVVEMLGGWPGYFGEAERRHGATILGLCRRDRILDEAVFGLVVRYAVHRAGYDRAGEELKAAEAAAGEAPKPSAEGGFLSGEEQRRAYHFNKCLILERELLATPYARARNGLSAQTTFMDLLEKAPKDLGGDNKVTPFVPLGRGGSGRRG